ncbi:MAG: hypothetical protein ACPGRD_00840, partial [Planktomarina sp.]
MSDLSQLLHQGEKIQGSYTPKFSQYLRAVLIITAITAVVFTLVLRFAFPLVTSVMTFEAPFMFEIFSLGIGLLMALGFINPMTWIRAHKRTWTITNYAIYVEDNETSLARHAFSELNAVRSLSPWQTLFESNDQAVISLEYLDMPKDQ